MLSESFWAIPQHHKKDSYRIMKNGFKKKIFLKNIEIDLLAALHAHKVSGCSVQ